MSCEDQDGGTHHYACACREKFYNDERFRMIRAFQAIQELIRDKDWAFSSADAEVIDLICREAIAPQKET